MTSKFQEKLKRLHDSRVKALASEPRVIEAEPEVDTEPSIENVVEPTLNRSPRLDGILRAKQLEQKTKASRVPKKKNTTSEPVSQTHQMASGAQTGSIGERVRALRLKITDSGPSDDVATLLYEMIALQPDNTFALSRLVQYHRDRGATEFAKLFAERLKSHAPF